MSGIYIHIPFCKQACHYCDFHFSTNLSGRNELVKMICREIALQSEYLDNKLTDTLYFGGGTPTLLSAKELDKIFNTILKYFTFNQNPEITIEANPDDLDENKVGELKESGINRLSIGIQSFNNNHLKYLNRAHNSHQAMSAVKNAQDNGFENISVDLIYGIPSIDHKIWVEDLHSALSLNVQHISSYCLTIEPRTVFGNWLGKKKINPVDDEFSSRQFEILVKTLDKNNFEQYEISNFSTPEFYSRHNSNYWRGSHYLGIGPSAHSFNGESRQYNIPNNSVYIKSMSENIIPFTIETLTDKDKINEYLLTSIRTKWGCDLYELKTKFKIDPAYYEALIETYKVNNFLNYENGLIKLTNKGKLIADKITSDLFIV
jgi:oxygen-independent coproporphyrinogen III oxidase